ncbi:MAG: SDR family oxidoreductase [Candidatus Sumerlaeaceae bacterium]
MNVEGSKVFVTGAAKRVGRAIAQELAIRGAHVIIHYNTSKEEAFALVRHLQAGGHSAEAVQANLEDVGRLGEFARSFDHIDVLINNASIFPRTPLVDMSWDVWQRILDINLSAPVLLATHVGLSMKERGRGVVINLTDCGVQRPYPHHLPYLVSKGGLETATRALAVELAPEVRVVAIAPGTVLPPPEISASFRKAMENRSLLRKVGSPAEVARTVVLAIENDFLTGCTITVDGGTTLA